MFRPSDILIEHHESVGSTNARAREIVESGRTADTAMLITASSQTASVGRQHREWHSLVGGLWCTLIWPVLADLPGVLDGLGLRVGVAVVQTVEHTLDTHGLVKDVDLKWPNDVLIDARKVAGILTETVSHDGTHFLLVGVGINANNTLPDLPDAVIKPVSLREVIGRDAVLSRLQDFLLERLAHACRAKGVDRETLIGARRALFGIGTRIRAEVAGKTVMQGVLEGLNDDGEIVCRTDSGLSAVPRGAEIIWTDLRGSPPE